LDYDDNQYLETWNSSRHPNRSDSLGNITNRVYAVCQ
jgi:hypothetical protein